MRTRRGPPPAARGQVRAFCRGGRCGTGLLLQWVEEADWWHGGRRAVAVDRRAGQARGAAGADHPVLVRCGRAAAGGPDRGRPAAVDAACAARLELVVTLRELGLGLPDVRRVLGGQVSIAEVAAVHLEALDAQIRALRLHRAVLAVVVKRAAGKEGMTLMNKLAQMSVAERRQMIDDFLAEVFEGINAARAPRWGAAWNLPDDPSPEQVDAWVELAELVSDPDFRQRMRQVMDIGRQVDARDGLQDWLGWVHENAVAAVLRGCPPDSAEAAQVLNRILEPAPGLHPADREKLIAGLEVTTDPRIERYWQLTATINGWPPFPSHMPGDLWLLAALRAHG